ncbi:membrane protein [Achromobacter sp. RTa]|uniref:type VI secretion system protein TssA n=1 Tax=Achromobacter sp. RTa TaxID=1532557 RepID=UPI00050FDA22|nr:type VI secretion system protein TssA [Achromobacter sp. RTa]KGE01394.1 membrane protein [Achromobacter sp. RTa]
MEFADILNTLDSRLPCGEDLEYDADFLQLQQAAAGRDEQQFGSTIIAAQPPDWREVERLARALLERTRDLRVIGLLTSAWTEIRGLPGYSDGLALAVDTLERYWEPVHPRLDSVGEDDPMPRMNALAAFGDMQGCARSVRSASLVSGVHGQLTLRDTEALLDGSRQDADSYPGGRPRLVERLRQAWAQDNADVMALASAAQALRRMQKLVMDKLGAVWAPDYAAILRTLDVVLDATRDAQPASAATAADAEAGMAPAAGAPPAAAPADRGVRWQDTPIQSREEAVAMLARVCAYFEANEPGHPAPYLIRRAQQLIPMSFHDIIKNLAPQGLEQFEAWLPREAGSRQDS